MDKIEEKLIELYGLLQVIPNECRGENNAANRHRYMKIKRTISDLVENL